MRAGGVQLPIAVQDALADLQFQVGYFVSARRHAEHPARGPRPPRRQRSPDQFVEAVEAGSLHFHPQLDFAAEGTRNGASEFDVGLRGLRFENERHLQLRIDQFVRARGFERHRDRHVVERAVDGQPQRLAGIGAQFALVHGDPGFALGIRVAQRDASAANLPEQFRACQDVAQTARSRRQVDAELAECRVDVGGNAELAKNASYVDVAGEQPESGAWLGAAQVHLNCTVECRIGHGRGKRGRVHVAFADTAVKGDAAYVERAAGEFLYPHFDVRIAEIDTLRQDRNVDHRPI